MAMKQAPTLVLASSSPYRRAALETLGVSFVCENPDIDESPRENESIAQQTARLAIAKARAVQTARSALNRSRIVVIGSDQIGHCADTRLTKPGTRERAVAQLAHMSGRRITFYSSLAVLTRSSVVSVVVPTELTMRCLDRAEIENYVGQEQPLDCAGAFKVEQLGIALFESIRSSDPSALVGLPLIALTTHLKRLGLNPLA